MINEILDDAKTRMNKSVESLNSELRRLRTGRANTALLDSIKVDYYGSATPLSQVANINVQDARTLSVQPWEKNMVQAIEKAILESDLGLNPMSAGDVMRIPIPPLTQERRMDLVKIVKSEGEGGKVAVRNIRRDAISHIKELLKDKDISEDDERRAEEQVQKLTDTYVASIDGLLKEKEDELMEI
ncbi:MAG: ribosome recycling factor [Gammaproteobacteria bacterium]|nr:ribosome recycling factor [Gammaproteobacteria bacterium]MDX2488326.1 ribosome recycling factor [Gammaproteobacteria bacterium]